MRLFVAALFVALAALSSDGAEERHDAGVIDVASWVGETPRSRPDHEAVLRAPTAGVAASPIRWAALAASSTLPRPSLVYGTRLSTPAAHASTHPQFRRFPLLI